MARWTFCILWACVLLAATAHSAPLAQSSSVSPTLEDVVFIESGVDRNTVFIGEAVTLTLKFGTLKFRGVRIQNYYKTRQTPMPDTEGFFAGKVQESEGEQKRKGYTYQVSTKQVRLFPTRAGELFIGAWRWQGTARGYTGEGARSKDIDRRTEPITISVKPLPPAPPAFGGAVGEFDVSATLEGTKLTQGVPVTMTFTIEGMGNPQSLRPPTPGEQDWYRMGDPGDGGTTDLPGRADAFARHFFFPVTPLQDGDFSIQPIAWTYFSPRESDYVTVTTPPIPVYVEPSGEDDELVVVGGVGRSGADNLVAMDDGRMPMAVYSGPLESRTPWAQSFLWLALAPVLIVLVVFAFRRGFRRGGDRVAPGAERLALALNHSKPADALRAVLLRELRGLAGARVDGCTPEEIKTLLCEQGRTDIAAELSWAVHRCEVFRYGQGAPTTRELEEVVERAGSAIDRAGRREGP